MTEPDNSVAFLEKPNAEHVPIKGNCAIGRSLTNEIVLVDDRVSRRHALVHVQEANEYWLVDLGSSNGTYVNGRRVTQPTRLRDGDQIDISQFRLVFRQPQGATSAARIGSVAEKTILDIKSSICWLLVADIEGSAQLSQSLAADVLPVVTGRWLAECKQTIEECGGSINKFLGDGFLAYWHEREKTASDVARAVTALKRLQAQAQPRFRVVLHYGQVFVGGVASLGEESLSGKEVNFVFRMEKLAAGLREPCLLSEPARDQLQSALATSEAGQHALPSFDGQFGFFKY